MSFRAAVLIGHDLILLPIAIGVGVLVVRIAPGWARPSALGALYASAVVTVIAFPFLIGVGRSPDNPSVLPLHYGRGLLSCSRSSGWSRPCRGPAAGRASRADGGE